MGARQSRRSVDITTTPKKESIPAEPSATGEVGEKIEKLGVIEEADAKPTSNGVAPHTETPEDKEKDKDEASEKDQEKELQMESLMNLSCKELRDTLQNFISDSRTLDILEDECTNGKSFMDLTQGDIIQMNIKMGPAKELLQIIKQFQGSHYELVGTFSIESDGKLEIDNKENVTSNSFHKDSNVLDENNDSSSSEKQFLNDTVKSMDSPLSKKQKIVESYDPNSLLLKPSCSKIIDLDSTIYTKTYTASTSIDKTLQKSQALIEEKQINVYKFSRYNTVENTLLNHKQGDEIIKAARTTFNEQDRRSLIRIVVAELAITQGTPYPPHEVKAKLAKAIISEYLSNIIFIIFIPLSKREYKNRKSITKSLKENSSAFILLTEDNLKEKVIFMKHKLLNLKNKNCIIEYLRNTYMNRRNWILQENPLVSEVIQKYPRLIDYNGEMVNEEFGLMFPDESATNSIATFEIYYQKRILSYANFCKPELLKKHANIIEENLRSIMILIELLPVSNSVKNKNKEKSNNRTKNS